jgi:hypothetical protein
MDDMCNMAVPAMIGAGLQLANTAMQARNASRDNREESEQLVERGAHEAAEIRRDNQRARAKHRVAMLKGGVTDSGSPTDTLLDLVQEGERDAHWAQLGYDQAARAKAREARRAPRSGVLDQLTTFNSLGGNLLQMQKQGEFK